MASKAFVENFDLVTRWFGCEHEEVEAFRVLCRGNLDAAESFMKIAAARIKQDPRYGVNERIRARIAAERGEPINTAPLGRIDVAKPLRTL